tara:strand:- start:237 stop:956 length:720 start_codon:yes stop_codon:yes gene_type:complete
MKKESLTRFIEKYNLNGNINSVILSCKDNKLNTRFITDDKTLLGELTMDNFKFEDSEFGIYSTDQLQKLISVLGSDINLTLNKADEKAYAIKMKDENVFIDYMLSDTNVINKAPNLKQIPDMDIKIKVNKKFTDTFIKGKNALADVDSFTVISDDNKVELVIGYSAINTNRVTIPVETIEHKACKKLSFNAKLLKDVLTVNKECDSAVFEISEGGLAKINFKVDDYNVTYYLVAHDEVD